MGPIFIRKPSLPNLNLASLQQVVRVYNKTQKNSDMAAEDLASIPALHGDVDFTQSSNKAQTLEPENPLLEYKSLLPFPELGDLSEITSRMPLSPTAKWGTLNSNAIDGRSDFRFQTRDDLQDALLRVKQVDEAVKNA